MVFRRSAIIVSALVVFLAYATGKARKRMAIIDPLKDSGLTDNELRTYRYLLALQTLSSYENKIPSDMSVEHIRKYIDETATCLCSVCGRWFLASVTRCPYHLVPMFQVTPDDLQKQIAEWEMFRQRYTQTSRIKITRAITIKLAYYVEHPTER